MFKKLLLFLIINALTILNHSAAQDLSIIPLKKPSLTLDEVEQKISLNIIKPLKKPSKIKIEKKIIKKNIKIS